MNSPYYTFYRKVSYFPNTCFHTAYSHHMSSGTSVTSTHSYVHLLCCYWCC